jgi:hypothetical protein
MCRNKSKEIIESREEIRKIGRDGGSEIECQSNQKPNL